MGSQQANSPSLNYGESSKLIVGHVDGTRLSCVVSVVLKVILTASESLFLWRGAPPTRSVPPAVPRVRTSDALYGTHEVSAKLQVRNPHAS
jgi:hypothetical protein